MKKRSERNSSSGGDTDFRTARHAAGNREHHISSRCQDQKNRRPDESHQYYGIHCEQGLDHHLVLDLRQAISDFIVVAFETSKDVSTAGKTGWFINAARCDADVIGIVHLIK